MAGADFIRAHCPSDQPLNLTLKLALPSSTHSIFISMHDNCRHYIHLFCFIQQYIHSSSEICILDFPLLPSRFQVQQYYPQDPFCFDLNATSSKMTSSTLSWNYRNLSCWSFHEQNRLDQHINNMLLQWPRKWGKVLISHRWCFNIIMSDQHVRPTK